MKFEVLGFLLMVILLLHFSKNFTHVSKILKQKGSMIHSEKIISVIP